MPPTIPPKRTSLSLSLSLCGERKKAGKEKKRKWGKDLPEFPDLPTYWTYLPGRSETDWRTKQKLGLKVSTSPFYGPGAKQTRPHPCLSSLIRRRARARPGPRVRSDRGWIAARSSGPALRPDHLTVQPSIQTVCGLSCILATLFFFLFFLLTAAPAQLAFFLLAMTLSQCSLLGFGSGAFFFLGFRLPQPSF